MEAQLGLGHHTAAEGRGSDHPLDVMQRVTDRTLELIEPAQGVMVGVVDADGVTYVAGAGNQTALVGTKVGLYWSLSGRAIRTNEVLHASDTELDDRVDIEACRRHFVRSLVCVPLRRGEEPIGVLAVNAPDPDVFTDEHVQKLGRLARFLSIAIGSALDLHVVSAELLELEGEVGAVAEDSVADAELYVARVLDPDGGIRVERTQHVRHVLDDPSKLSIVFQPVIDLETDTIVAVEALSRFDLAPQRTPDLWFADAHRCDLGLELELLALEAALSHLDSLDGIALAINVGPDVARSPEFLATLADLPLDHLILELTEHAFVDDYPALNAALRPLRRSGLRVAIDDTGSGYSSLSHIIKIAPDFIKLDCELTRGIDMDPVRRALAASLVTFAADTGAEIIAEGVETADELEVFRRLGVRFAQGYQLGHPATLGALARLRAAAGAEDAPEADLGGDPPCWAGTVTDERDEPPTDIG